MTVPFDLVNLLMSETGVLKKLRHNYFLKNSHCAQIAKYFCSSHRKRYSKKGMDTCKCDQSCGHTF